MGRNMGRNECLWLAIATSGMKSIRPSGIRMTP